MLNIPTFAAALTTTASDKNPSAPDGGSRMLGKLLKYELRATARLYFPLYLAVLILAALWRVSFFGVMSRNISGDEYGFHAALSQADGPLGDLVGMVVSFVLFAYVLMVLGAFVVHFIITIQRFWKNLMGDEGYLMFTLPVSTDALLWSKAIPALIWTVATLVAVGLSVLILCGHPVVFQIIDAVILQNLSNASWQRIDILWTRAFPPFFWLLMLLAAVAHGLSNAFHLYAAMAIGHTARGHKILTSVGAYMVINMMEGVVSGFLSSSLMPIVSRPLKQLPTGDYLFLTVEEVARVADALGQTLCGFMLMVLAVTVVFGLAVYLAARYILTTQLNLE